MIFSNKFGFILETVFSYVSRITQCKMTLTTGLTPLQKNSFIGLANGGKSYVLLSLLKGENGLNYDFFSSFEF